MAILTISICSILAVVMFGFVCFNCLSEQALCKVILFKMNLTNKTPQAIVERAVSFDSEKVVYSYEKYRSLTSVYDDIVDVYIPLGRRRVPLDVFECHLADLGMAYAPNHDGATIITI
tara:strand:- start:230 stop:583 length:354 start_codon:yes stop_codon:yes gene_type:complete